MPFQDWPDNVLLEIPGDGDILRRRVRVFMEHRYKALKKLLVSTRVTTEFSSTFMNVYGYQESVRAHFKMPFSPVSPDESC